MNFDAVIIDDDNDSVDTVEILDEDVVPNSCNQNSIVKNAINLHEETRRGPKHVIEIEIDGICSRNNSDTNITEDSFANLLRNNKLMSKLVKKCLNMENSDGMTRVIHKTVLPMYKDTDSSFKESAHLRRLIKTTLKKLELDPWHKFSHIKSLCDLMQSKKHRKKVPFVTLFTDLQNNRTQPVLPENNNTFQAFTTDNVNKTNEEDTDVIDLVNSDKDLINNTEGENDVIILDDDTGYLTPRSGNSDKENNRLTNEIDSRSTYVVQLDTEIPNDSVDKNNLLLVVHNDLVDENVVMKKIQMIEAEIATCKSIVAHLEEQEVTDSNQSAYLRCDKIKVKIVKLYEELCKLTGEEAVKRREVRLQVTEGHPAGPVKKLEEFLNRNIDDTGTVPFPDLHDVVNCVQKANKDDGLGWTKEQVMKESISLFTQCGQALRRRRQKREWRDLMSLVKEEQPDRDPANDDPQLLVRLEENKRIAREKERDILERFTQMEYQPTVSSPLSPRLGNMLLQDTFDDTTDEDSETEYGNIESTGSGVKNCEIATNNVDTDNMNVDLDDNIPSNYVAEATDVGSELPVQIKQEPKDIQSLLDGLGSDYTVTVCDIEDPFLVIEISSDSSYSDDDNL